VNLSGEVRWYLGGDYALITYSEDNAFSIDQVIVPAAHRGKGIGSALIQRVLILADSLDKEVFLSARTIDGSGGEARLQRLVSYYTRFGFEPIDRGLTVVHLSRKRKGLRRTDISDSLLCPQIETRNR
jgi:GNAT superfamily N-acetyltransferase